MADPFDAALDLLRRLPPSSTQQNLTGIISLRPDLEEDLLSSVDVALTARRCPKSGRDYLCCDYNRDGNSYRSPWSNSFEPPLEDTADDDDGGELVPTGRVRRMEESLNSAVDVYRELYYEGGVSSAYLWALDEGFAGVVLFKKTASGTGKGGWDSIHVLEVNEAAGKRSAHYKLTSTVILDLGLSSSSVDNLDLAGNLTRQTQSDLSLGGFRDSEVEQGHVVNIGRMVEDMETRMRNLLQEVYFGKAKDVVGDLRSIQPLSEAERDKAAHRDVINTAGLSRTLAIISTQLRPTRIKNARHHQYQSSPSPTNTSTTKESSLFGKLAPELRNRIYELVLTESEPFTVVLSHVLSRLRHQEITYTAPLALTVTCRGIRTEATPLFYGANTFVFRPWRYGVSPAALIDEFRGQIGEANAEALRSVVFEVGQSYGQYLYPLISNLMAVCAGNPVCALKLTSYISWTVLDRNCKVTEPRINIDLNVARLGESIGIARRAIEVRLGAATGQFEAGELGKLSRDWKELERSLQEVAAGLKGV